ncbi:hypothetical protein P879_11345 [Paragonimus westermani]|uniref:Uncharacterized protein n=1 Tax=Paragonimus westermani TaxID=34504 RepID=A0A8T0DA32_9TREM|nr:hypothetical protein P879_11345 [Paragonimus westermani]
MFTVQSKDRNQLWKKLFYHGTQLRELLPNERLCKWFVNALRSTTGVCHEALLTCTAAPQPWNPQLAEFAIRLYFSSKCVQLRCPTLSNGKSVQQLLEFVNRRLNPRNTSSLTFVGEILLCTCDMNTNYLTSNYIEVVTRICFSVSSICSLIIE